MSLTALLAAPFAGSLAGVLIRRLPAGRPVTFARSACDRCHHPLGPLDLVPLLSFAALRGRCRHCGAPIGWFHPAVEAAAMLVPLACMAAGAPVWAGCALGWPLLTLAWIDAERFLLPDVLTLPLLVAGLALCAWQTPDALADRAAAAILAWLGLRAVALSYRAWRGRDGLGQGDAKLYAAGAAWTGLAALPQVLLAAALIGLAGAAVASLRGRTVTRATRLPFGPPLALGIWIVWLWQA